MDSYEQAKQAWDREIAAIKDQLPTEDFSPDDVPLDFLEPKWGEYSKVHCWRNHVGDALAEIWDTFTPVQKAVIAADAERRASNEDWD